MRGRNGNTQCANILALAYKGLKKKKIEKIAVFPFSVYNSYFRQFVSVIGYIVTRTRWSDT